MRFRRARPVVGIPAVLIAAAALSCRSGSGPVKSEPARDAPGAALELFRAAREGRPPEDLVPLLDGDLVPARRAALGILLGELEKTTSARVVEEGPAGDRTAVDLEATLRGGGTARYHLQVREEGGSWRVVSVVGPGASWPNAPSPGGDGLSTSAPPRGDP